MPAIEDCCRPCPTVQPVNIPGSQGGAGTNGLNGANGANAYTVTTADTVIPAVNNTEIFPVANSGFMAIGQNVFLSDGANIGNFKTVSFPSVSSVELEFLGYTGDSSPGATISAGASVVAAGQQGSPPANTFANGMTTGTTKGTAQTNLGLGQNALVSNSIGLTQVITNSFVEVGTCDVTVATAGVYLILADATITMAGVTFSSSRTITLRLRNVTQGTTISTADFPTQILTTQNEPALKIKVPFLTDATAVAADHYQLQITIDVVNSAGTLQVSAGSLCAVPLRFS